MFTNKHKKLMDQLKQYSNFKHKNFNVMYVEPSYPLHIKDLGFNRSLLYLGKDFILIELFWRFQPQVGKNEICELIYSILELIAFECDTKFAVGSNPDVEIKSILINGFPIADIESLK